MNSNANKKTTKKNNNAKNSSMAKNKKTKKNKVKLKFLKWVFIIAILVGIIALIMLSDLFNIKQIIVKNSLNVTTQQVIDLSTLQVGENMFKTPKYKIKENIKTNPYISDVKIKKHLNGYVEIEITERTEEYMLQIGEQYMYIDAQGYMLKLSTVNINKPIISGYKTPQEEVKPGNRLCTDDLIQLDILNQICETARTKGIIERITGIDISDSTNYKLILQDEKKIVHFGDSTNIIDKVGWIEYFIEQEKGIEGDIFLNQKRNYFREKV